MELLGILQKFDQFLNLVLRFFDASDIFESDAIFIFRKHSSLGLAKVQRALARHFDLRAEEEIEDDEEKNDRQEANDGRCEEVRLGSDRWSDAGFAEGLFDFGTVELCENRRVEGNGNFLAGCWRRKFEFALEILRVATFLNDELEGRLGTDNELALLHQLDEARVLDLLDLSEIVSPE